jgi:hypothetical protein
MTILGAYRRFLEDRRSQISNEWAIVGLIALTFAPLLIANAIATAW